MGRRDIMYRTITFILVMMFAIPFVYSVHDCESTSATNSGSKWNKTYLNCLTEPVLNTTFINNTTQVTQLNIINYTFDETIISKAIQNQTVLINTYVGELNALNYTKGLLLLENDVLRSDNQKFKNLNPSYDNLRFMYNTTQQTLLITQNALESEKSNKLLYIGGGVVAGFAVLSFLQQRQKQPEERLFPTGARTKGEGEPIKSVDADTIIRDKIRELGGG